MYDRRVVLPLRGGQLIYVMVASPIFERRQSRSTLNSREVVRTPGAVGRLTTPTAIPSPGLLQPGILRYGKDFPHQCDDSNYRALISWAPLTPLAARKRRDLDPTSSHIKTNAYKFIGCRSRWAADAVGDADDSRSLVQTPDHIGSGVTQYQIPTRSRARTGLRRNFKNLFRHLNHTHPKKACKAGYVCTYVFVCG